MHQLAYWIKDQPRPPKSAEDILLPPGFNPDDPWTAEIHTASTAPMRLTLKHRLTNQKPVLTIGMGAIVGDYCNKTVSLLEQNLGSNDDLSIASATVKLCLEAIKEVSQTMTIVRTLACIAQEAPQP